MEQKEYELWKLVALSPKFGLGIMLAVGPQSNLTLLTPWFLSL